MAEAARQGQRDDDEMDLDRAGEGVQPVIRALKGQNIPAQGNALGTGNVEN